eukprot:2873818-Rhodomonas_salina.1
MPLLSRFVPVSIFCSVLPDMPRLSGHGKRLPRSENRKGGVPLIINGFSVGMRIFLVAEMLSGGWVGVPQKTRKSKQSLPPLTTPSSRAQQRSVVTALDPGSPARDPSTTPGTFPGSVRSQVGKPNLPSIRINRSNVGSVKEGTGPHKHCRFGLCRERWDTSWGAQIPKKKGRKGRAALLRRQV